MPYSDEMATSTGVSETYAAATGSPYTPLKSGRLIKMRLAVFGTAATSLIEGLTIKLTNPMWGVPITFNVAGAGVRTAPAHPIPVFEFNDVNAPVQIGSPITIEYKYTTTPVTPIFSLVGIFS